MRKIGIILFSVLMAVLCLIPTDGFAARAASATLEFDKTNVLDDLMTSNADGSSFDVTDYPYKDGEGARIINFVEYCYSYKENMQSNYALYIYVYNPSGLTFDTDNYGNKIQLAVGYDKDKLPDDYKKFDLIYCNKSESNNYHNLFYKFRISDPEKEILNQVNSNKRRYDVSGFELVTTGASNAVEYLVGGTYTFEGYVKGYGPDINAESNLVSEVNELETVRLNIKSDYYRTGVSSTGRNHQNQLNSVYFAVPNSLRNKYGKLQKIKAEWYEYKTAPIIVTDDIALYNDIYPRLGVDIGDQSSAFTSKLWYELSSVTSGMGVTNMYYAWSYNIRQYSDITGGVHSQRYLNRLTHLFYTGGAPASTYTLPGEKLKNHILKYDKSFVGGKLPIKNGQISADLFLSTVDDGRTKAYNCHDIDSDDTFDMLSYDSSHNGLDKFIHYGFWSPDTSEEYGNVSPIHEVTEGDFKTGDVNRTLLVSDVMGLRNYYDDQTPASKEFPDGKTVYLFRFAMTDYYSFGLEARNPNKYLKNNAYYAQETVFLDFDILQLTFNREGVYKVIPVVSSPIDIVSSITPPLDWNNPDGCGNVGLWFVIILLILIGVPLIIALMFKFPDIAVALLNLLIFLAKGLFYVVTSPYWIIKAIVQKVNSKKPAIKKTKPKAKSRKKKAGSPSRKRKSGKPFKKTIDKRKRAAPKKKDGNKFFAYHLKRFFNIVLTIVLFPLYLIVFFVTKSIKDGTPTKDELANKTHKKSKQAKRLVPVEIKNHKDNKGGHPHVIVDGIDNKHVSVGLSTKPKKGKNATNYKLEVSPLNDGKQSYMKRQGTVDKKDMYYNSRKGKMAPIDYSKAKEYGDKAKRKYIEKKDKKK